MSFVRSIALAAIIALPAASLASASELIRIEPRPYYGAVVSIESGVRVYRGLPAQSLMIINPDNKTPVSLNFSRSVEHRAPIESAPIYGGGDGGEGGIRYGGGAFYPGLGTNPTRNRRNVAGTPAGVRMHKLRDHKPKHH